MSGSVTSKDDHLFMAKLSEQAERYQGTRIVFIDMVEHMKQVVKLAPDLTVEERNLLSVAYKNIIGIRRASWRIVSSIEAKEESKGSDDHVSKIRVYRARIEEEMTSICNDILELLDSTLVPAANSAESKVFYYKVKGDYFRYLAEFTSGDPRKNASEKSLDGYQKATDIAVGELPSTHPIRLGLTLNFSVFYYEIMNVPEKACQLAKQAFDDAIAELDSLPEESYKDSTLIMQLLRDNLTLWTSDIQENEKTEHKEADNGDKQ